MSKCPIDYYFQRFGFCERQIQSPPHPDLGLSVVIPCFDEPDLAGSLSALWNCASPACAVEVILVINSAAGSGSDLRARNEQSRLQAVEWARRHSAPRRTLHVLHFPELPLKQAGVGLARKVGMDEALRRFDDVGRSEGIIACFDADCRCEPNYLVALEHHFRSHPLSPGCSIYFEHSFTGVPGSVADEAIASYELHLRYYIQALRYAGFPYAHHTVGSAMAVKADIYRQQGGMNKQQAGEDFYFLQKIIHLGGFTDLAETKVIPSARPSHRVPFGTGKSVADYLRKRELKTYPLPAFLDLKDLLARALEILAGKSTEPMATGISAAARSFLEAEQFGQALKEIVENTASGATRQKRFFQWFNGFRTMKFIHHARDHFYGPQDLAEAARKLLALKAKAGTEVSPDLSEARLGELSSLELLTIFRRLDRGGTIGKRFELGIQPRMDANPRG